ncbi:hypothetical protein EYM_06640 [Ignicoccus islandicus DSM 13165]|uniref:Hydrogenase maturation protease n=1 Tax=Ignicoccus islandicus DSM 13165 TaxID=940295 RepID=A0A0U2WP23_9CREN|nr:hypothetical protein [Ignicoccus islandicus]ALU12705.1 hypothetical protein EYM_06640 [Ignicoccus islandicus DSM 13165]
MKVLAFIASSLHEQSYALLNLFEVELKDKLEEMGVKVVDASADAPTVVDLIKEANPEEIVLVGVSLSRKEPGVYVYKPKPKEVRDYYELATLARATLTGYLDISALIDGIQVFAPELLEKMIVVECVPPCKDLKEKVLEVLKAS